MKYVIILLLLIGSRCATAQIGFTKDSVRAELTNDHDLDSALFGHIEYGITDGLEKTLQYDPLYYYAKGEILNQGIKDYDFTTYYYFKNNICRLVKELQPIRNINNIIKTNDAMFVKLADLKWKDYRTNTIIEVVKQDNYLVEMYY